MEEETHETRGSQPKASKLEKWNAEKRKLEIQIETIVSQLKQVEAQKKESISNYVRKIAEKDLAMEEEKRKRVEMEKKLRAAEQAGEKETRDHADELWRHKKAFAELVSSHRQLEAEMGRALQQIEAARTELEEMFRQREEAMAMAMQLSAEINEMRRDSDTKEKVLSDLTVKKIELENREDTKGIHSKGIFFSMAAQEQGEEWRKDEKLEAYKWRLLTMELQTERLQSHVEGLEGKLSSLRKERAKLENQLSEREEELRSLRKQVDLQWQYCRHMESNRSPASSSPCPRPLWLELKKEQEEDQRNEATVHTGNQTPVLFSRNFTGSLEMNEKNSLKKVDLHALALSYKINRLKQQLHSFEKLAGNQETGRDMDNGLRQLLPVLHKQARKYRSLEEKAEDLCGRMEKEDEGRRRGSSLKALLEEAFRIQRYVVGAGQRSAELNSKIASGDVSGSGERFLHYSAGQFGDVIRALLRDIQRGLEVRVARIIGNLEGTLARDGILRIRPRADGLSEMGAKEGGSFPVKMAFP